MSEERVEDWVREDVGVRGEGCWERGERAEGWDTCERAVEGNKGLLSTVVL